MTTTPRNEPLPPIVGFVGYAGVLPFAGIALVAWVDAAHAPLWQFTLLAYGAVIVSFVGALHWGVAMTASRADDGLGRRWSGLYAWSVVPALLAWAALLAQALLVHGMAWAVALLVLAFVVHYVLDRRMARAMNMPSWYLPLRLRLTAVACLCLLSQSMLMNTAGAPDAGHPFPSAAPPEAPMRLRDTIRARDDGVRDTGAPMAFRLVVCSRQCSPGGTASPTSTKYL